jgi:hypothetical protein
MFAMVKRGNKNVDTPDIYTITHNFHVHKRETRLAINDRDVALYFTQIIAYRLASRRSLTVGAVATTTI